MTCTHYPPDPTCVWCKLRKGLPTYGLPFCSDCQRKDKRIAELEKVARVLLNTAEIDADISTVCTDDLHALKALLEGDEELPEPPQEKENG